MKINSYSNGSGIYTAIQPMDFHGYPQVKACDFRWADRVQPEEGKWFNGACHSNRQIGSEVWIDLRGWHIESDGYVPVSGFLRSICRYDDKIEVVGAIIHVAMEGRIIGASFACFAPNIEVSTVIASAVELGLEPNPDSPWMGHNALIGGDEVTLRAFSESALCAYANVVLADRGVETLRTLFLGR